jgi:polyhydroxybutyrate depolymerase
MPLVLVLHGGGSNAEAMVRFCGMNQKADQAGFLVAYPRGTGRLPRALTFNGGNCCGYAQRQEIDDVAMVRALLDDLQKAAAVDPRRIFATGMSNGGIMAYRLASELADRIAAIAPVAGPMGTENCQPSRPVPVMHFHGTEDAFAPFKGGRGSRSLTQTNFYSVEHSIRCWVEANGCPKVPVESEIPNKANDGMKITRQVFGPGKAGAEVVLISIEGGGHTWPGQEPQVSFLGPTTMGISANDLMWEFFQRHPMP